ncbi:MAG: hypothetical protein HOP15_16045, partial [Planctomycetes bacterium]|nr:hypothetical protein [Planctomycetota bacterium]
GRVRAGGEPLADAQVFAHRARGDGNAEDGPQATSSSTQSDAEGVYELALPGAGRYALMLHSGNFGSLSWSTTLDVPEVTEFVFDVAIPLGRISGRVTNAAGAALAEIWVQAEPERHEGSAHGGARTQTDEDGRYELALPAGTHAVSAGGDMGWGSDEAGKYVAERVSALVVSENGHVRGIDFVLSAGGTLAGSVRAPDGTPARWVQIWSGDAERVRTIGWCQDSGSFHIRGLEPGTHWICATSQDNRATSAATRVELEAGKTTRVELELVPATLVRVRVRDAAGAEVGCEIEVLDGETRRQPLHSGGELGETLVGPLGAGRYTVRARREEKLVELAFEVSATQPNLELELAFE